jgi:hypothetical protein
MGGIGHIDDSEFGGTNDGNDEEMSRSNINTSAKKLRGIACSVTSRDLYSSGTFTDTNLLPYPTG